MTINETIVKDLEDASGKCLPDELKRYLLVKYAQEPFPYEYSEQDLCMNIERDIRAYEAGELDVALKSRSERWQEEREYLQNLYIEKCREAHDLSEYIRELELTLSKNGLESPKRRIELSRATSF